MRTKLFRNYERVAALTVGTRKVPTVGSNKHLGLKPKSSRPLWQYILRIAFIALLASSTLIGSFNLRADAASLTDNENFSSQVLTPQVAVSVQGNRIGATASEQTLNLAVSLKVNSQAVLDKFLQELYDPSSPNYHHYLTPQEFTSSFIDTTNRNAVVNFLKSKNLTVKDSGLGSIVDASGTVSQVEAAFNLHIADYNDSTGRIFYSNDFTPALPVSISKNIQGIVGLSNYAQMHSHLAKQKPGSNSNTTSGQPRTPSGCTDAEMTSVAQGSYTPNEFASAYDIFSLYQNNIKGQGQTIALFELDDYNDSDVQAYQNCFGTAVPVQRVLVDESSHTPGSGLGEVELDIDVAVGIAPNLSNLLVYESPVNNPASYLDQYQQIASDNKAKTISTSWGTCEIYDTNNFSNNYEVAAENTIFQQFAAQGQSFFAAAGDYGSEDCEAGPAANSISVDDPASQPYITGVGGTSLKINSDNSYQAETVWNEYNLINQQGYPGGAGGGGLSGVWAKPTYQLSPAITNTYSNGKRQVPDLSADADPTTGYVVYVQGNFGSAGGTSAAAPLWATIAALTNQYLTNNGKAVLGFANPSIYQIFGSTPSTFHDITIGDNCYVPASGCGTPNSGAGKYFAAAGYDEASGVGSVDAASFAYAESQIVGTNPIGGSGNTYSYYLPYLANSASGFTSYLAFQNIGTGQAQFNLKFYNADGSLAVTPTLSGACTILVANAECLPSNPFGVGKNGTGVISSNQPLNVIVAEATPYGGSAYVVVQGSSNNLVVPISMHNAYGDFSTQLTIFNGGSSSTGVQVQFFDHNGVAQSSATKNLTILAHTSQSVNQAASTSGLPSGFNGWARITSTSGSQLVAQTLEQSPSQHFVAIANAVPASSAASTLYAPAIFNGAFGFVTGANIVNPNSNSVQISIAYYDNSGTASTATAFTLNALSTASIYQGGTSGNGLPSGGLTQGFSGAAIVSSSGGNVLMVVNESGGVSANGTSLSGVYAAASSGSGSVGLPVMANGGYGYTTGATILNTSGNTVSGSIQYYNPDGTPQGNAHSFSIAPYASQLAYQGDPAQSLPAGSYGSAVVSENGGGNDLIVTTNAESGLFYTYTEPNQ